MLYQKESNPSKIVGIIRESGNIENLGSATCPIKSMTIESSIIPNE